MVPQPKRSGLPSGYDQGSFHHVGRKRKKSALGSWLTTGAILAAVVVMGAIGWEFLLRDRSTLEISPIADQEISEGAKIRMRIPLHLVGYDPSQLRFSLQGAPNGAVLDAKTGEFTWAASEPGSFPMTVKVVSLGAKPRSHERVFTIRVRGVPKKEKVVEAPAPEMEKPPEQNPFEVPGEVTPQGKIDELVFAKLKELKIQPAFLCSDGVFVRRVYLDMIGTLPTAQEAKDFLADKNPDKRRVLIDQLFQRPEFADYWAMKWSDILRIKAEFPINLWPNAAQAYHHWIRVAIRDNMPYDRFVRELLTASGSNFRSPQVNFFRALQKKDPPSIAKAVALAFMGVRVEKWPTEKLAGMATFFSKVGYKPTGEWKEEIVQFDPRKSSKPAGGAAPAKPEPGKSKGKPAAVVAAPQAAQALAIFPDGTRAKLPPGKDPREVFADWLISPDNPWFARHIVNRKWYWLMGRGIVHEPDDIRPDNPAQNPELLNYLGQELINAKYDMRHIYRLILNSKTYQLSSISRSKDPQAEANFAFYVPRRLEAETMIDAICQITGTTEVYMSIIPEPYSYIPENLRSTLLPDGSITSAFLETFGRPSRDSGLESERNNKISANQRLHLLNSTHIREKIEKGAKMAELLQGTGDGRQMAETLYLAILSRLPTEEESSLAQGYCGSREGGKTIAWALINGDEFLYRH
jgi:hypothetical protein